MKTRATHIGLFLVAFLACAARLPAQEPVVQQADTLRFVGDTLLPTEAASPGRWKTYWNRDYPNPRKALILSFALPGAGQIYNRKWWKVPIVYGALGALTWVEINNIREYRALRDNYLLLVDGDDNTNPTEAPYIFLDATQTKYYRDVYRRYVEQSSLALGLAYILAATDAFVDAHLASFDVSDDLSLRVTPRTQAVPGMGPAFGVGLTLDLGTRKTVAPPWTNP
jgi:hypothetical protein